MFLFAVLLAINAEEFYDKVEKIEEYTDINFLLAIQILVKSTDSKDFVDRPTKKPLKEVKQEFEKIQSKLGFPKVSYTNERYSPKRVKKNYLTDHTVELGMDKLENLTKLGILNKFLDENFHPVGYDIQEHNPEDWSKDPAFLSDLKDDQLKKISQGLNITWKELSRKKKEIENNGTSTLFDLPHPFIVPGGRFREFYYWDTYWILEGLLVCDMHASAENIVKNFIYIINKYGYIPNGTRKYYLYRSQPPYFTLMLLKLLDIEDNKYNDLVFGDGLKAAEKEYEFWMKYKSINITDKDGKEHLLNYYHVPTDFPRPESFAEDIITYQRQKQKRPETEVFSNIKSGAESGWDFSSRWFKNEKSIDSIQSFDQMPVDLNAILYRNEIILSTLFSRKGEKIKALYFLEKSEKRANAINAILWNEKIGCWNDFVISEKKFVDKRFYFSNIMPMIYGMKPPKSDYTIYNIMMLYAKELFGYPGGIPVSGNNGVLTGQQWDFPNVWAPHQHMMAEFLLNIKEDEWALHVAKSFYESIFHGYKEKKEFYEKYNCEKTGSTGGGGEYVPQTGFGWTNGTALSFILKFKDDLAKENKFEDSYKDILVKLEEKIKSPPTEPSMPETENPLHKIVFDQLKVPDFIMNEIKEE
ncbi:hypothetical protein GVAV_000920 [Gurleya vavrai]